MQGPLELAAPCRSGDRVVRGGGLVGPPPATWWSGRFGTIKTRTSRLAVGDAAVRHLQLWLAQQPLCDASAGGASGMPLGGGGNGGALPSAEWPGELAQPPGGAPVTQHSGP